MIQVELNNVTKIIKRHKVIDNISLSMHGGNVIGFHGYNGSGKTMLMRLILGLIYPTNGTVKINDQVIGKHIEFPPSVGMLIENPAFLADYSGKKNLQLLMALQEIEDRSEDLLIRVGLDPNDQRNYKKYSLGMKQRLGIAASIIGEPDLIVLDEPTNALDENGIRLLKNIILEERSRGALVLLACHDNNFLTELSDKIYHINEGKITHED